MKLIEHRIRRMEQRRRPRVPVVVRWSSPEPGQLDTKTGEPVALGERVQIVAYLDNQGMWEVL